MSETITATCPTCGKLADFTLRRKETREPHGEYTYQEWWECCLCGGHCTHDELAAEEPLCPDSPDGNHHSVPIGSEEDLTLACTSCWYCGEKATEYPEEESELERAPR